jgi:hypothetical protein
MTSVIQATIMNAETASAALAFGVTLNGASQIAKGMATQKKAFRARTKELRFESVSIMPVCGLAAETIDADDINADPDALLSASKALPSIPCVSSFPQAPSRVLDGPERHTPH